MAILCSSTDHGIKGLGNKSSLFTVSMWRQGIHQSTIPYKPHICAFVEKLELIQTVSFLKHVYAKKAREPILADCCLVSCMMW